MRDYQPGLYTGIKTVCRRRWRSVDLTQLLDAEAAAEIDRRAGDGQRELQRLADEAEETIRGTL